MQTSQINRNNEIIECIKVAGTNITETTLSNIAPVDNGDGTVKLAVADDFFKANSHVYIEGTTNYDGLREIVSAPAGFINIKADFIAETPAGTETVKIGYKFTTPGELFGIQVRLSVAPTTSENMSVTKDDGISSDYDLVMLTKDFSDGSVTNYIHMLPEDTRIPVFKDDVLRVSWDNSDARTYGLKLFIRRWQ